jgi:2-hydroxy-6-oxonona-2,4-dienedioate hydrolase
VRMFADALGLDKFHLSGNSAGCTISCNFVITHPDRVLSVAFIAGGLGDIVEAPRVPPKEGKFTPNPDYVSPGFDGSEESMRVLMEGIIYEAKAIWPELITMRVKAALKQREARIAAGLPMFAGANPPIDDPNMRQKYSTKNRLDKLTIPMIYLYGMQDVLSPVENGFNQEDVCPNIQFFYPDQCGHQGQTDQPEMFNQVFLEFFRDGRVSRRTPTGRACPSGAPSCRTSSSRPYPRRCRSCQPGHRLQQVAAARGSWTRPTSFGAAAGCNGAQVSPRACLTASQLV